MTPTTIPVRYERSSGPSSNNHNQQHLAPSQNNRIVFPTLSSQSNANNNIPHINSNTANIRIYHGTGVASSSVHSGHSLSSQFLTSSQRLNNLNSNNNNNNHIFPMRTSGTQTNNSNSFYTRINDQYGVELRHSINDQSDDTFQYFFSTESNDTKHLNNNWKKIIIHTSRVMLDPKLEYRITTVEYANGTVVEETREYRNEEFEKKSETPTSSTVSSSSAQAQEASSSPAPPPAETSRRPESRLAGGFSPASDMINSDEAQTPLQTSTSASETTENIIQTRVLNSEQSSPEETKNSDSDFDDKKVEAPLVAQNSESNKPEEATHRVEEVVLANDVFFMPENKKEQVEPQQESNNKETSLQKKKIEQPKLEARTAEQENAESNKPENEKQLETPEEKTLSNKSEPLNNIENVILEDASSKSQENETIKVERAAVMSSNIAEPNETFANVEPDTRAEVNESQVKQAPRILESEVPVERKEEPLNEKPSESVVNQNNTSDMEKVVTPAAVTNTADEPEKIIQDEVKSVDENNDLAPPSSIQTFSSSPDSSERASQIQDKMAIVDLTQPTEVSEPEVRTQVESVLAAQTASEPLVKREKYPDSDLLKDEADFDKITENNQNFVEIELPRPSLTYNENDNSAPKQTETDKQDTVVAHSESKILNHNDGENTTPRSIETDKQEVTVVQNENENSDLNIDSSIKELIKDITDKLTTSDEQK